MASFVIKDEDGNNVYRLRHYNNWLCYVVDEWGERKNRKTGEVTWEWKQMELYPRTIDQAMLSINKRMIIRDLGEIEGSDEIVACVKRCTNRILKACKEVDRDG